MFFLERIRESNKKQLFSYFKQKDSTELSNARLPSTLSGSGYPRPEETIILFKVERCLSIRLSAQLKLKFSLTDWTFPVISLLVFVRLYAIFFWGGSHL